MRDKSARRVLWSTITAGAVVAVALMIPHGEGSPDRDATARPPAGDGHGHDHADPATKNAVSRAGEVAGTVDPTSADEARRNTTAVAQGRRSVDPTLKRVRRSPRREVPQNRYAMAGGCYTLASPDGYVGAAGRLATRRRAERFTFQATDLGSYLLYDPRRRFVASDGDVTLADRPSPAADWTVRRAGRRFTFRLADGSNLTMGGRGLVSGAKPTRFGLRRARGCTAYPEAKVNITGNPHGGVTSYQEVRGYVDAHTHGMAFEFLGGKAHCGRPWHRYGIASALVDCADHSLTGGNGAALEAALSGEPTHDPVGWPTFKDWPAPHSLTHEGTYYKWMERAWRGGQRIFVNLLVENGQLCKIYPLKKNSCDDMDSIRLQAQDMRAMERYIDAQHGGPGRGWYRIVTDPWQARKVINAGKLAVVMGIETSVPFGCTFKKTPAGDVDECNTRDIDRQLDEVHRLGVRQMELVNKFDNALAGVAGDAGEVGTAVNAANILETGSAWDMRHCEPADGESADKTQIAVPDLSGGQQDALFGAVARLGLGLPSLPVYPPPMHCNSRGLTSLGAHLIDKLIDRKMLFDPDHMSVSARKASLTQLERRNYAGVLSSHSWSTPDAYPRIYRLGGFVAPYAGDSTGFHEKWKRHLGWADKRFYFGFGFGADMNGLGAQGNPRGADGVLPNPVRYPFTGINGIKVAQQRSGQRVYDINADGVSHYGLYPDWVEDLRQVGGAKDGAAIVEDMTRGPEAYLQTWERAYGMRPDSCRNPELRRRVGAFVRAVRPGMSIRRVQTEVGQPFTRLGTEFGYCAKAADGRKVAMTVVLTRSGRVSVVRRRS